MKILKVKCLAPTRLDNYLMQQFPALNPGRLNKALRENKIKLNGKKQPLSTRVMAGDEIKLFILDNVLDADKRVDGPAWKNARGPAQVVYDCPQILIVNKPAGLAVDGPDDDTLLNRALLYLNQHIIYCKLDHFFPNISNFPVNLRKYLHRQKCACYGNTAAIIFLQCSLPNTFFMKLKCFDIFNIQLAV